MTNEEVDEMCREELKEAATLFVQAERTLGSEEATGIFLAEYLSAMTAEGTTDEARGHIGLWQEAVELQIQYIEEAEQIERDQAEDDAEMQRATERLDAEMG